MCVCVSPASLGMDMCACVCDPCLFWSPYAYRQKGGKDVGVLSHFLCDYQSCPKSIRNRPARSDLEIIWDRTGRQCGKFWGIQVSDNCLPPSP